MKHHILLIRTSTFDYLRIELELLLEWFFEILLVFPNDSIQIPAPEYVQVGSGFGRGGGAAVCCIVEMGNGGSRMAAMVACTVCAMSVGYSTEEAVTQVAECVLLLKQPGWCQSDLNL